MSCFRVSGWLFRSSSDLQVGSGWGVGRVQAFLADHWSYIVKGIRHAGSSVSITCAPRPVAGLQANSPRDSLGASGAAVTLLLL